MIDEESDLVCPNVLTQARFDNAMSALFGRRNEDARKTLAKKGIVTVDPSKEMVDEPTAAAAGGLAEMPAKVYSKDEFDMAIRYRDEYRAKQPKE